MMHAWKLVFGLLITAAGCAVSAAPEVTDSAAVSTRSDELSVAAPEASSKITPNTVTCDNIWECDPVCGTYIGGVLVRYSTNVLHQYCSDGSDTVVRTDPCGEDCF